MDTHLQVFRARVAPEDVERLLAVRPVAIAQARAACSELLRAELVQLDEHTWLDLLTWSAPDGADRLMAAAGEAHDLDALHEMHGLVGQVLAVEQGRVAHTSQPVAGAVAVVEGTA